MKCILFDCGGTLDSDGETWLVRFERLYREAGIECSSDRFLRAFYECDDALASDHDLKPLGLKETVDLQVLGVLKNLAPGQAGLKDQIVSRFVEDCRRHFSRNRPVLERLGRRWKLGVVSNFYGNLESVLRSEGLLDLFGVVADSGVLGITKPDAGIFEYAAKALGCTPADCLMVGDSRPRDMKGAEDLGMPHAWVAPAAPAPCCPRGWTLSSITELGDRLDPARSPVEA